MFETILKENLEFLRFRGFAVDRLLNRHQEEQRMAKAKKEAEEKERRLQARLREERTREETRRAAEVAAATPEMNGNGHIKDVKGNQSTIPGAWQEHTDEQPPTYTPEHQPRPRVSQPGGRTGLLNSIRNAIGIPDPLTPHSSGTQPPEAPPAPHFPTSKASIDQQLARAVNAGRPFNQKELFNPATSQMVHEAPQSYCDTTEAHDLALYDKSPPWGFETFYVPKEQSAAWATFSSKHADIQQFAALLKRLAAVYSVRLDSFHLFLDPKGRTIAFNRQGSLFFNITYVPPVF
jgi:hypothetical protein